MSEIPEKQPEKGELHAGRKQNPASHSLPTKRKKLPPFLNKAPEAPKSEGPEKSNRLLEILARRKADSTPVFKDEVPEASIPLPSNIPGAQKQFIEKAENAVSSGFEKLHEKFPGKSRFHLKIRALKMQMIERRGIYRLLAHPFITQFFPPTEEEWTWRRFLRTRGFERIAYIVVLIFVSCVFYTCGGRESELKRHEALVAYAPKTNSTESLEEFYDFLRLKKQGKFNSAYEKLLHLENVSGQNLGGLDRQTGEILIALGEPREAQTYLENAIHKNESSSDAHAVLGTIAYSFPSQILSLVPSDNLAENHFNKAVEADPGNANAYILWGIFLQSKGEYAEALKKFELSQLVQESSTNTELREIYEAICRDKLNLPPDPKTAGTAAEFFTTALHDFEHDADEQGAESLAKAQAMVSPEIYKIVTAGTLFKDHIESPMVK